MNAAKVLSLIAIFGCIVAAFCEGNGAVYFGSSKATGLELSDLYSAVTRHFFDSADIATEAVDPFQKPNSLVVLLSSSTANVEFAKQVRSLFGTSSVITNMGSLINTQQVALNQKTRSYKIFSNQKCAAEINAMGIDEEAEFITQLVNTASCKSTQTPTLFIFSVNNQQLAKITQQSLADSRTVVVTSVAAVATSAVSTAQQDLDATIIGYQCGIWITIIFIFATAAGAYSISAIDYANDSLLMVTDSSKTY